MGVLVNSIYQNKAFLENLIILTSVLQIYTVCEGLRCEGFYKGCCPGSSWNSTSQKCEPCLPGYSGVNCSLSCPYPSYGVECQQSCNCIQDSCDVSTGCIINNKDDELTAALPTMKAEENNTVIFITMKNQKYSNMPNSSTMTLSTEEMIMVRILQSNEFNDLLLKLIKIIGYIDTFLICTYIGLCIYDRKHRTLQVTDINDTIFRNTTPYENIEIVLFPTTGNHLS